LVVCGETGLGEVDVDPDAVFRSVDVEVFLVDVGDHVLDGGEVAGLAELDVLHGNGALLHAAPVDGAGGGGVAGPWGGLHEDREGEAGVFVHGHQLGGSAGGAEALAGDAELAGGEHEVGGSGAGDGKGNAEDGGGFGGVLGGSALGGGSEGFEGDGALGVSLAWSRMVTEIRRSPVWTAPAVMHSKSPGLGCLSVTVK